MYDLLVKRGVSGLYDRIAYTTAGRRVVFVWCGVFEGVQNKSRCTVQTHSAVWRGDGARCRRGETVMPMGKGLSKNGIRGDTVTVLSVGGAHSIDRIYGYA